MKNCLVRKLLALVIIILFIGSGVISSLGIYIEEKKTNLPISKGNILYVGGSGPNNYTKIQNAIDIGYNNTWDNGYPSGGNYWDDYNGIDEDGDGIGDTPYPIPYGDNEDRYPLMKPWNNTFPFANFTYSADESPALFNGSSSYDSNGEIISYEWKFGDGKNGTGEIIYHKYCEIGTYKVSLTVTDNDGYKGKITKSVKVTKANVLPTAEIYGPRQGVRGVELNFTFIITDPDDDAVYILINWGDGEPADWLGPYKPGETFNISHLWEKIGVFTIYVGLKDSCDILGDWATFTIEIPRTKMPINSLFLRIIYQFLNIFPFLKIIFV